MTASWKKQKTATCLALIAIILLCLICSCFAVFNAETSEDSNIKVVHITDLHYYPTYKCYKQSNVDYTSSAMYKKGVLESKLVLESSAVLKKLFADILATAKVNSSKKDSATIPPDYLLVTGDLSSDGERFALIDIANALRDLQNKIREQNNPDFQVFVIPGNHDISNQDATDYSTASGAQAQGVTRLEFAKIFAGLGYPDMEKSEGDRYFANDIVADENLEYLPYDAIDGGYVYSPNATDIQFEYMAQNFASGELKDGELTYVAKTPTTTFVAIDGVCKGSVAGRVQKTVFDWLKGKNASGQNILTGQNLISLTHHNVLPHFTMQEQYTKSYLFANWEETRDFLLANKVKYNFSGHMHANNVATYCDTKGFNLYDLETGSPVGCGASYREAKITFFKNGDSDMYQTPRTIRNVDVDILMQNGYLTVGQNIGFDEQVNDKNVIVDLAGYIDERLYSNMLDNVLDSFICFVSKENFVDYLMTIAKNKLSESKVLANIFADQSEALRIVLGNFYDQIQTKTLLNFEYDGDKEFLQGPENKLRAYLYNFAKSVIDIEIAPGYTVQNMFVDAYTTHLKGGENKEIASGTNLSIAFEWMQSGDFVRAIVSKINDNSNGLVILMKKILSESYNLTEPGTLDLEQIRSINMILAPYFCRLESFSLDKFVKNFAGDKLAQMPSDLIDNKVSNLLLDNMAKGIGENFCDVVRSLVTDASDDSIVDIELLVRFDELHDEHSHFADGKIRNAAVNDGRLPSMVTMTFGEDVSADRNFVWFTDKSMMASDFQLAEGDKDVFSKGDTNFEFFEGQSEVYAVDYPLIDLGILTTYTTKEVVRHSFSLKGLKPETIYSYRVGDKERGRWGTIFTFKTPLAEERAPFEVLITTDVQGISKSTYQNYAKMLSAAQSTATNGFDFMINLGDMVNDGRNANQWRYLLEEGKYAYATLPQVIAPGNHDAGEFKISEGYVPSEGAVTSGYSPIDLHFSTGGKTYYSYDYKGVHFVVLDTNDIVGDDINFTQLKWLTEDLKQNKDNLVVVSMHKGIYSAGPHRNDTEIVNMRKTLSSLFSEYKVELVLQGHDHIYSESFFLDGDGKKTKTPVYKQGAPINNNNGGVLYVTMGSSGDKFYDFDVNTDDFINKGKMFHSPKLKRPTFGKLVFDGREIRFYSYQYDLQADRLIQLKLFSNNSIVLITSIVAIVVIVVGVALLIFFMLRNHKKKIEQCKHWDDYDKEQE